MRQFSPQELQSYLQQAEQKPCLLDVREPFEYEICAIKGSINIPLHRIPEALDELDPDQEYVLICHHGVRSQQAGTFMANSGFDDAKLINLVGGIDAWAIDIDVNMARY